jgi:hypothetical protein
MAIWRASSAGLVVPNHNDIPYDERSLVHRQQSMILKAVSHPKRFDVTVDVGRYRLVAVSFQFLSSLPRELVMRVDN